MKAVALIGLAVAVFLATLVGAMAASGNLSKDNIERLVKGPPTPAELPEPEDDVGPLTAALRTREEKLKQREAKVKAREERVSQMLADLDELREEVVAIQQQIADALDSDDEDRLDRRKDVALSLSEMKPENAAKTLDDWPVEDAADILRMIKEKDRGKILDGMDTDKASVLLRALQERKL